MKILENTLLEPLTNAYTAYSFSHQWENPKDAGLKAERPRSYALKTYIFRP